MQFIHRTSGFTLIELLVGMTVFAIGLTGVYALLQTTMSNVSYSRDEIIVSGLLREQVELVMNIRDTNLRNYIPWDSVYIEGSTQTNFASGIYLIENDFTTSNISIDSSNGHITHYPIKLTKIDPFPTTDEAKWQKTQIHLDSRGRYFHSETTGAPTQFASYIMISPLTVAGSEVRNNGNNQGWIIDARVLVKRNGGIREYDAKSMITDWQR